MNGKNDMNALVMKHEKELEATKREMILVKDLADRQRAEELAKREEEWDKTRKEVGEYGFICLASSSIDTIPFLAFFFFFQIDQRERQWREEKQEVLAEVQRLKAEAGRMVAILAMEVS